MSRMIHRKSSEARKNILERLRKAPPFNWDANWPGEVPGNSVFPPVADLLGQFTDELESLGGRVAVAHGVKALYKQLKGVLDERGIRSVTVPDSSLAEALQKAGIDVEPIADYDADFEVGITSCEALVSLTGGVLVSSAGTGGRRINVFPPVHIVLARGSQLVATIHDGFKRIEQEYGEKSPSQITLISGPSRTADIEKTLVLGAHGPRELMVMIDLNR